MATALQQQLAAIAASSTHQLDLKAQKARHSQSLLFEPRDAASQSFDTIYHVCIQGFHDLCALDARFAPFARSLFSEQSKNEDRTQMTAQENADLDHTIETFLGLLGARLLLVPAMKTAEWLVRRFRVQEYNTEAVLLTFLPYHTSHIFPPLLSILPDQLPTSFRFLHPYVASRQCPPRHAVLAAAVKNTTLFTAFSGYVLNVARAGHHSAILLRYWASLTAQTVNGMIDATRSGRDVIRRQKEEDLLLKVLPILQAGLAMRGVSELYLGLCMIVVILTKASLSDKVIDALMEAVAGAWTEETLKEGITCLALLAEEKEDVSIPKAVMQALVQQAAFMDHIDKIADSIRVEKLLVGASFGAMRFSAKNQDARGLLIASLQSSDVSDPYKVDILAALLESIKVNTDDEGMQQQLLVVLSACAREPEEARLILTAAKRSKVNLSQLGSDLALLLRAPEENDGDDGDEMELDSTSAAGRQSLDLEGLPQLSSKQSFLDHANDSLYDRYCATFLRALQSAESLYALLDLPSFDRAACMKRPGPLSFFARAWTTSTRGSVRLKALQITTELLLQVKQDERAVDMQALMPYLVAALADPVKSVRSAAAAACLAINDLYKSKTTEHKSVEIWSQDSLYGTASSSIQWMSSSDAEKLLCDAILPTLEDSIVDENYITNALNNMLSGPSAATKHERRDLKSALRTATYSFLASHVVTSPSHVLKLRVLRIIGNVGKAAGSHRVHILLPFVKKHIASTSDNLQPTDDAALTTALVGSITHLSPEEIQLLKDLAASATSYSKLAFDRLRRIWKSFKDQAQTDLVAWLLDLSLAEDTPDDIKSDATELLSSISLPTEILVHLVESLPTTSKLQGLPSPARKQRTSRGSDVTKLVSLDKQKLNRSILRITTVLELVEESKPEKHPHLLKPLFHFLSELHHYKALLDSELVYLQGLVVNSLLAVVNELKASPNKDVDRTAIRADLIVDCVRTTSSTQVRHAALLLMSALASWAPDLVLHSVMPLFTFMSSTILKQGDDYSAHVTDQTVAQIIPPLAASLKRRGKDLVTGAADLLLSFTAAFEHIPLHRRSALFQHLVTTLGPNESLFAIVAMLVERYPEDVGVGSFISSLMNGFPVSVQLHAINQYLDLVIDSQKAKRGLSDAILGFGEKKKEQANDSTSALLEGLANVLSFQGLRKKLAKELKLDDDVARNFRVTYSRLLEKAMQLDLQLKSNATLHVHASNLLTALLGLMPTSDFIDSSAQLMQTGSDEIREQVFASLEQRVKTAKRGDADLQQIFMDVLPNCTVFVMRSQPVDVRLAAIACIDRISEKFGKTNPDLVLEAAKTIAGVDALASDDHKLRHVSILCLASMVEILEDQYAGVLQIALQHTLSYLEATIEEDDIDEHLVNACFSLAMAVLDYIPWMLAGDALSRFMICAAKAEEYDSARQFAGLAARKVAPETLLAVLNKIWEEALLEGFDGVSLVQGVLRQTVQHHSKSVVTKNARALFDILLKAFDLRRRLLPSLGEDDDASELFDLVNSTAMDAVLKLNDATFRPFFLQFAERSFAGNSNDRTGMVLRSTSLFSFAFMFFEQLKSLVTGYAAFLLEDTAKLLESLSSLKTHEKNLLDLILQTLASSFNNDQDAFWQSPSHFDVVVQPLLNLLAEASSFSPDVYLIPAITELASTANSPEHHKTINASLMGFMRNEHAMIRLAAVKTQRALTEKLEIDWCNFLPEWVPLMSELQEDDEGMVEREVLRWMGEVGKVTGEEIEDMMR